MNINLIKKYFDPKSILDIGANIGQFYTECSGHFPSADYVLIEANASCEKYLKLLDKEYYIATLSNEKSERLFYSRKSEPLCTGNSMYRENTVFFKDEDLITEKIQTTTLNHIFGSNRTFDLIKIDTQGSEIDVINGGRELISKAKGIILEVSIVEYNIGSPLKDEVYSFMKSINFIPSELLGNIHHPIDRSLIQQDILFIQS